jgi:uncharacterized membrane protein
MESGVITMDRLVLTRLATGMTKTWDFVTVVAAVGCGLVAGVLFAFSTFVMSGLTRLPASHGLAAMQSINITAVRPPFMLAFFGTAVACVALGVHVVTTRGARDNVLLLVAVGLYLIGTVGLTVAYNVPLNDKLARVDPGAADAARQWHDYTTAWTAANHVRTLTALAAAVLLVLVLCRGADDGVGAKAGQDASRVTSSV